MTVSPELKLFVRIVFCIVIGLVLAIGIAIRPKPSRGADAGDRAEKHTGGNTNAKGNSAARVRRMTHWWAYIAWFIVGTAVAFVFLTSDRLYS